MNAERRHEAGFTLLEAMVALVIVALGMMAVNTQLGHFAATTIHIEQKTLASWIATNRITELSIQNQWPELGDDEEEIDYAGRTWLVRTEVLETPVDNLRRVDVEVSFLAIGDSGGPLTKDAIRDGTITMGDIYTADPAIATNDLVVLEDPQNLILPQQVTPLVSEKVDEAAATVIDAIQAELTSEELRQLNARSVDEQERSDVIAREWLQSKGLID